MVSHGGNSKMTSDLMWVASVVCGSSGSNRVVSRQFNLGQKSILGYGEWGSSWKRGKVGERTKYKKKKIVEVTKQLSSLP